MSSFENHTENLHVGKKVDRVTVIKVSEKSYVVQCSCGNKITKKLFAQIPQMCKTCAKINHRSNFVPTKDSESGYVIRPLTRWEDMSVREFLRKRNVKNK